MRRIKQFLDSFDSTKFIKIYTGTFDGNQQSEEQIKELKNLGYNVTTKPVKIANLFAGLEKFRRVLRVK